jgi:hypothetical protein
MPHLSIIPAAAVADNQLTDLQLRVLCAIGTFSNRLGGNVWASVSTLAKQSNLSDRSVQRALPALIDAGYIRGTTRPGRTNLYEVVLEGVTVQSPGGDSVVTPPPTTQSPKRLKKTNEHNVLAQQILTRIWSVFPAREEPHVYPAALKGVCQALDGGAGAPALVLAAEAYARHVMREKIEKKYVKSMARFYSDGVWQSFTVKTVHGRTREEWARSGQDVTVFDRMESDA